VLAGLSLLLVGGGAVLYPSASRWVRAERSVDRDRIRTARVTRGDLERDLSVQGQIVAAFHPTLYSPEQGLVRVLVKAGESIRVGQELARVMSPELSSRLARERSTLLAAEADLDRRKIAAQQAALESRQRIDLLEVQTTAAERAKVRAEDSREAGILNLVELERAQDDHKVRVLELEHARETARLQKDTLEFEAKNQELLVENQRLLVRELERQTSELTLRSPVNGQVSRLDVAESEAVVRGQALLTVVDLSAFEVEILVPESYAGEIAEGTPAAIKYDSADFTGEVKRMSPEVEGSQVRGVVAFTGTSPEGLKQNQRVSIRLLMESRPDVLKVARGPFLENGGGRQAYVLDGDLAELRTIQSGAASVSEVEIVSGLEEGEEIIISDMTRFQGAATLLLRH
jgi:HlyD family secretion protein